MKISEFPCMQAEYKNLQKDFPQSKIPEQKQVERSASELTGNYNIAFCGLFNKKAAPIDASTLLDSIKMAPENEYIVSNDTKFELSTYTLDLASKDVKPLIDALKPKQSLVFGRCDINPNDEMPDSVSRQHLKITRNKKGQLIAQDLNSKHGTRIKSKFLNPERNSFLEPGKNYAIPSNGVIFLGKESIYMGDLNSIDEGIPLILGRGKNSNIYINEAHVSNDHLKVTRLGSNYIVKDLNSTNGTQYLGEVHNFAQDYSQINTPVFLQKNVPTRVPKDSQLYLGFDLTIDLRNKNILNELEDKKIITVGRSEKCDFVVPPFYNHVSREHLRIEKNGNDIVVSDLNSMNYTQVIPKNAIKPFYGDLNNLSLQQANIGDCYLLSTIYGLSKNSKGRELLQRMVQVDDDGNYNVTFYNKEPIKVTLEELDGQTDKKGHQKKSVSGDLGIKAIERAYGKMLKEESFISLVNDDVKTMFFKIDNGGNPAKTLQKLVGVKAVSHPTWLGSVRGILYDVARNGIENHVLMCSTSPKEPYDGFKDPQHRFVGNHAYGIGSIDVLHQTVGIVNPHNTKRMEIISWQEFDKYFDYLDVARL